jgi:hypothetical protein
LLPKITGAALILWFSLAVSAGETGPTTASVASAPKPAAKADAGEASILTMLRHSAPSKPHALLDRMAGRWTTRTRYCMRPGTEPVEANGTSIRRWILEGRFLLEELEGGDLGLPFRGIGLFGYDAFEQQYTSAWVDTTSTAILTNFGRYDATNDQVRFAGEYKDPWTGVKKPSRGATRFVGPDQVVLELHVTEPDGKEFLMLEITYTRRASPSP